MTVLTQITEVDKTIKLVREFWVDAAVKEKPKYMERIDGLLDERLRLMKIRDEENQNQQRQDQTPLS